MYSLNVPVPSEVSRLARGLAADLLDATPRDRHTLVAKRLGEGDPRLFAREIREIIAGTPPFSASVTGIDAFHHPPAGRAPVVYLRVESPTLVALHRELCEHYEPVAGFEGDGYDPHITIARGGDADRLLQRDLDVSVEWTVDSLFVWSAGYGEPVERIALPA